METIGDFKFEPVSDKYTEEIKNKISGPRVHYHVDAIIHPSKCAMNSNFKKYIKIIQDFKVFPDDIWVVAFPRCGTTWTQEMVWLLANGLDYETAKEVPLKVRFPFLEWESFVSKSDNAFYKPTLDLAANASRPRYIKSHLPIKLLPKDLWTVKPKIIYIARDPRDTAISYYHHHRLRSSYTGTLQDFIEVFLADRVTYSPYWAHVLDFYKIKEQPNILFNSYEDMKRDLRSVIEKTADFLNVNLTESKTDQLQDHLSFENMKNNASCNYSHVDVGSNVKEKDDENLRFIRKGESGGWRRVLSSDILDKFDKWNKRNLYGIGLEDYPWS